MWTRIQPVKYGKTIAYEGVFQMLAAITRREESFDAFRVLRENLERSAAKKRRRCTVGFRGGSQELDVLEFPDEKFWAWLGEFDEALKSTNEDFVPNRFWCAYGVGVPRDGQSLHITCEINPPYENPNLKYGGLFAKDQAGNAYLCHTGKIGGGRQGIGKKRFLKLYRGIRGNEVPVRIGDRKKSDNVIVLGRIDDGYLPIQISHFVREVSRIKQKIVEDGPESSDASPSFLPEFSGPRRSYSMNGAIESNVHHGIVVGELAYAIEEEGHAPHNDRARDMYLIDTRRRRVSVLFEIKTNTATTDIYQAVGQLMFNGRVRDPKTRLVFVAPDELEKSTDDYFEKLKIDVLRYKWSHGKPIFSPEELRRILD